MKIPIPQHQIKFPNLERNAFLVLYVALILAAIIGLLVEILQYDNREKDAAKRQAVAERQAIQQHHAAEVTP